MGANEDFKRLAREMAEKARAQREKAARAAREGEGAENGEQPADQTPPPAGEDRKPDSA